MSEIFDSMQAEYHECFGSWSMPKNFEEIFEEDPHPGFWYTVDILGEPVRTGCARNMKNVMDKLQQWDNEQKIYI